MTVIRAHEILQDVEAMADDHRLYEAVGGDVYIEAASSFLVEQAGPQILDMLQHLVDDAGAEESTLDASREALAGGLEFLEPFIAQVITHIRKTNDILLADLFSEPLSMIEVLRDFLQGTGLKAQAFNLTRSQSLKSGQFQGSSEHFVFGLFTSTSASRVLRDAFPLYLVTMYSIWDLITRRMLGYLQAKAIMVANPNGGQIRQGRWLYDMRFSVFQGDHFPLAVVSLFGLMVWSIAFPLTLFRILLRGKYRLQEKSFVRSFGYFYNGLEPNMFWWDVLLKKGDILLLYIVTFTELFHDPKAKLIMYLGFSGFFWSAHNMFHPYDNRQNRLADRLEDLGLATRFVTVFLLQVIIMVSQYQQVNAVVAITIMILNIRFLATVVFVLVVEQPNTTDEAAFKRRTTRKAGSRSLGGLICKLLNCVGPVIGLFLRALTVLARSKETISKKVPHLQWQGPGRDLIVITHEEEKLPWHERLYSMSVGRLYRLGEDEQKTYVANTISRFWDYILNHSDCHKLPSTVMDTFFALPTCLQKECAEQNPDSSTAFHVRVARRVRKIQMECQSRNRSQVVPQLAQQGSRWSTDLDDDSPARRSTHQEQDGRRSTRVRISLLGDATTTPNRNSRASSREEPGVGRVSRRTRRSVRATATSSQRDVTRLSYFHHATPLPEHTNSGEDFNSALLFIQSLSRSDVHEFLVESAVPLEVAENRRSSRRDAPGVARETLCDIGGEECLLGEERDI